MIRDKEKWKTTRDKVEESPQLKMSLCQNINWIQD